MKPRFLPDTHILLRCLAKARRLSRHHRRVLQETVRRHESVAISAITLPEIAVLFGEGSARSALPLDGLLGEVASHPAIAILPIATEIAAEVGAIGPSLRDPAARATASTARLHRLRLLTADQRILDSNLVPTI